MFLELPHVLESRFREILRAVNHAGFHGRVGDNVTNADCQVGLDSRFRNNDWFFLRKRERGTFLSVGRADIYQVIDPSRTSELVVDLLKRISCGTPARVALSQEADVGAIVREEKWDLQELKERLYTQAGSGWKPLDVSHAVKFAERFHAFFEVDRKDGFPEPVPFRTWSLGPIRQDISETHSQEEILTRWFASRLRKTVNTGELMLVLVPAVCVWEFDISRCPDIFVRRYWPTVFVDPEPTFFLATDFEFGVMRHFSEDTITAFGAKLIHAIQQCSDPLALPLLRSRS